MSEQKKAPSGPDLTAGVSADALRQEGQILGHVGKDDVLVVQVGHEIFAVGARCTHYRGPLAEGLVVGDTVRCPWHHACFSLRTGEHLRAPALDPIACWRVEQAGDRVVVKEKLPAVDSRARQPQRRRRSSLLAAERPESPPSTHCAAKGSAVRSPWSALMRMRRTIARTCRRTTSRAARPRIGCRCAMPRTTRSSPSG